MDKSAHSPLIATCRSAFTAALLLAVKESGIRSPALTEALQNGAGQVFDELAGLRNQEEFKRLRGITASRISLVHPDDMDLTVELINLAHDLADACERELPRLHLLFMSLLGQDSSVLDQLPVGPDAVCAALRTMCDQGELTGEVRIEFPMRAKSALIATLRDLYSKLTDFLEQEGIEPFSLVRSGQDPARAAHPVLPSAPAAREGGGMGYRTGGQVSLSEAREMDAPLNRLQGTLLRRHSDVRGGSVGGGQIDPSLLAAIVERVLVWLDERQQSAAAQPAGSNTPTTSLAELNALLPAGNNAALDAVVVSFDMLQAEPALCAAIKPSLERLRLPLCKLALTDAQVFTNRAHPARQLLDTLLRLALSLPADALPTHPVCQAIEHAAHSVQQTFGRDPAVFAGAHNQLQALEQTRHAAMIQRCVPMVSVAESETQREHSRTRAARAIRALCAGDVPPPVRAFLEQLWVRVLATIHQHVGEKSQPWLRALAAANELVDSVHPKADAAARQQLVIRLPQLLAKLRAGLDAIGTPEALRERAFQSFVECHTAVIQGRTPQIGTVERLEISSSARIDTVANVPGLHIVRLPPDGEPERNAPGWINALATGQWLNLALPDEASRCLCIGWCGGSPRLLLAADPDSDYALLFPQRWLLQCAQVGWATPVMRDGAFERAAEAAIARYH